MSIISRILGINVTTVRRFSPAQITPKVGEKGKRKHLFPLFYSLGLYCASLGGDKMGEAGIRCMYETVCVRVWKRRGKNQAGGGRDERQAVGERGR